MYSNPSPYGLSISVESVLSIYVLNISRETGLWRVQIDFIHPFLAVTSWYAQLRCPPTPIRLSTSGLTLPVLVHAPSRSAVSKGSVTGRLGVQRQACIAKQLMLKMLKHACAWASPAPLSMKLKLLKLTQAWASLSNRIKGLHSSI
jgi:hypothetical protein